MEGTSKKMTKHEKILAASDRVMAYWSGLMVGYLIWTDALIWNVIAYWIIGMAITIIIFKAVEIFWTRTK
jgi:hypothetical protein